MDDCAFLVKSIYFVKKNTENNQKTLKMSKKH